MNRFIPITSNLLKSTIHLPKLRSTYSTIPTSPPPPATPTPSTPSETLLKSDVIPPTTKDQKPELKPSLALSYLDPPTQTRSKSKRESSTEKQRALLTRTLLIGSFIGSIGLVGFGIREWDDETEKMKLIGRSDDFDTIALLDEGGYKGMYARAVLRAEDYSNYLNKPAWEPLIPPPLPEPHGRPFTLVIDLDDLLVSSTWDAKNGWRTAKRPGVDYFLGYLSQFYEIVLFTTQPSYTAIPIVEKLDPYGARIPWKLFRDSTRYKNGSLIKDLSYMGRPLEKIVMLDTKAEHVQLQKTNSILLTPWSPTSDKTTTKELTSLIPFLEALVIKNVPDVRKVIDYYKGEHIPTAYAKAELTQKQALLADWELKKSSNSGSGTFISSILVALGGKPKVEREPELQIELIRKQAIQSYLAEEKYWKDNELNIKAQMEEDRERQLKEMKGSLLGFLAGGQQKSAE